MLAATGDPKGTGHGDRLRPDAPAAAPVLRWALVGCAAVLLGGGCSTAGPEHSATTADTEQVVCAEFFDDFAYWGADDPRLADNGWYVRSHPGGPGPTEATWSAQGVSFSEEEGQSVLRLGAVTDGTPEGTVQTEIGTSEYKFREGTYAARVRLSDGPVSGLDGHPVVQSLWMTTPAEHDDDRHYGELDVEYLPNGGRLADGPALFTTSWNTREDPGGDAYARHTADGPAEGWRLLVVQVTGETVRYLVDGEPVARHDGRYYPVAPMSLGFGQWFVDAARPVGYDTRYEQDVDWVYFSTAEEVPTDEVVDRVDRKRAAGTTHLDEVDPLCGT